MVYLIVGLLGGVFYLAHKSAPTGTVSNIPPDTNLPSSGATSTFSPAVTGGQPLVSKANRLRLGTNYSNVRQNRGGSLVLQPQAGSSPGILGGMTNATSDGGYKREAAPVRTTQPKSYKPNAGLVTRYKF